MEFRRSSVWIETPLPRVFLPYPSIGLWVIFSMLHRESYPKYTDTFIKERENIRYKYLDSHQYTTQNEMGRRIVGKIAGSTSKRQFMRPIIQIEPQPSLQVPKRQFKRPGSQAIQQVHLLL